MPMPLAKRGRGALGGKLQARSPRSCHRPQRKASDSLLSEYVYYHHEDRTHLGLEKDTPNPRPVAVNSPQSMIMSLPRLGGRHHRCDIAASELRASRCCSESSKSSTLVRLYQLEPRPSRSSRFDGRMIRQQWSFFPLANPARPVLATHRRSFQLVCRCLTHGDFATAIGARGSAAPRPGSRPRPISGKLQPVHRRRS
jgi:hypothetical protein